MSWLSGLAGKAEDLLNKIDQNAAIALHKSPGPQIAVDDSVLVEVASHGDVSLSKRSAVMDNSVSVQNFMKPLPTVKSYPNLAATTGFGIATDSNTKSKSTSRDDDLMRFLNSPKIGKKLPKKNDIVCSIGSEGLYSTAPQQPALPVVTSTSKSKRNLEVEVDYALKQGKDEDCVAVVADGVEGFEVQGEAAALRSEVRVKEKEALAARRKLGESQQEVDLLRNRVTSMEVHLSEVQDMYSRALEDSKKIAEAAIAGRFQAQSELDRMKNEFSYSMDDKTRALELLKSKMEGELVAANNKTSSLQRRYDALVEELRNERLELERYRARAQAVLAGRDREIADLRAMGAPSEPSGADTPEGNREEERQMWEEETLKLREEVARCRGSVEESRRQWDVEREGMEDDLLTERGRREAAEEQEKATVQELRSVRAELERLRLGELELRQKLSKEEERKKVGTRGGDWEGRSVLVRDVVDDSVSERLAALTSTLIEKQIRVESLTAERNALRLQLEKTDHLYRDAVAHLGQSSSSSSVPGQNDTDDVKARIPSFLLESPFDTAVTRKVKRAYSSLDSVGVRVGIFLRRYPLARTLLLSYTVLLHLWVVIVLLTYTPDVH